MLLLVNNPMLMGRYINRRTYNYLAWGLTIVIIGLTGFMLYSQVKS
jgi:Mn2+/Fe2+ NRAMP family transporter